MLLVALAPDPLPSATVDTAAGVSPPTAPVLSAGAASADASAETDIAAAGLGLAPVLPAPALSADSGGVTFPRIASETNVSLMSSASADPLCDSVLLERDPDRELIHAPARVRDSSAAAAGAVPAGAGVGGLESSTLSVDSSFRYLPGERTQSTLFDSAPVESTGGAHTGGTTAALNSEGVEPLAAEPHQPQERPSQPDAGSQRAALIAERLKQYDAVALRVGGAFEAGLAGVLGGEGKHFGFTLSFCSLCLD